MTMCIRINASYGFSFPLDQYTAAFYCTRVKMKTKPVPAKNPCLSFWFHGKYTAYQAIKRLKLLLFNY
jgi:hypothetical protein